MRILTRIIATSLLLLAAITIAAAAPHIAIAPDAPRVGDVIFLHMRPESELLRAACSWAGKSYPLLANGETYDVTLPVSLEAKPCATHAVLYWKYANGSMGKEVIPIEIRSREFGIQHLKLSSRQERTYSAPETKREKRLIGAALDLVTEKQIWNGDFLMPVEGRISTGFGLQRYVNGKFSYRHKGVDLACPEGTPVKATADGTVSLAADDFILHGQTVIIDHGHGISSLYIHLSSVGVSPGQFVHRGDVIGLVGSTGVATGPHLHFAVYAHHEAVDPFFWMDLPAS